MAEETTAELLARLTIEVILEELARRAVMAGMSTEDFIREQRESIRLGREENAAGRQEGHENDPPSEMPIAGLTAPEAE